MIPATSDITQRPDTEDAIFFRFAQRESIPAGKWGIDFELPLLAAGEMELTPMEYLSQIWETAVGCPARRASEPMIRELLQDFPGTVISVSHDRSKAEP